MPFASPLALLGLLFVPAVIAMYLLRLRRTETIVPSTLLWQRLAADVEANAPWQKLRRSLLFLLQLLLVAILAFLAARPFLERPAGLARDLVLIVDTSASMAATDVPPDRLTAAKAAAIEALKDLPSGGKVSVIEAGRTARIVATGTTDLGRVRQAIESIRPTISRGNLGDALALAQQLAIQSGDAEVLVATDAALAVPPTTRVDAPIRVLRVGDAKGSRNQAIVALAVRTAATLTRSVFVSVANLDLESATRRLEVWSDDRLLETRTITIDAQARADVIIDDIPKDATILDVRLVGGRRRRRERPARPARERRSGVGGHPAGPRPEHPRRRRRRSVSRDRPVLPAQQPPLRPEAERVSGGRGPDRRDRLGSDHLRGLRPGFAPDDAHPRHRAAEDERARRGRRDAEEPGHRHARDRRADPALRRPDDDPHLRGAPDDAAGVGPLRHPGPEERSPPLLRRAGRLPRRGPRLRAAPVRSAAPGRLPDPARQPDRRAARRVGRADDRRSSPGDPVDPRPSRAGRPGCASSPPTAGRST